MSTFDNFVQCRVASPIAASATSLELHAAVAPYNLPPDGGGVLVLTDSPGNPSKIEIIRYASRSALGLYGVERGQEGTEAINWTGPVYCYQALMAQDLQRLLGEKAPLESPALTGAPTAPNADLSNNSQQIANTAFVRAAIANLVESSPESLDTLSELAAALDNDPDFATTMVNELAKKVGKVAGKALSENDFTNALLDKLNNIQAKATRNRLDTENADKIHGHKISDVEDLESRLNKASGALFVKPVRGKPLLEKVSPTSVKIPAGLSSVVTGKLVTLDAGITLSLATDLTGSTAVAGTDYFVYLEADGTAYISASDTEISGRLIAGFHYSLVGHTEARSGNKTEADMIKLRGINAHTFWDLSWRANKGTNRGLTFDGINWIDIYLADEHYAVRGWSKAGGWIAGGAVSTGRKLPVIPDIFGGNGSATYGKLTPFVAWDMLNAAGMEPINYKQFSHAMYGVEEGLPSASIETVAGKIEHYPRLTSRYGIEQATGVQWIWGADLASRTDRPNAFAWREITDGRGQVYTLDDYTIVNVLLGAARGDGVGLPGSRASRWDLGLTYSVWSIGVRGLRDHLTLD